jgi:hypothetical protein
MNSIENLSIKTCSTAMHQTVQGRGNVCDLGCGVGHIARSLSLIHGARSAILHVLRAFWRILLPGGHLLIAVHHGDGELHAEEFWGQPVSIDATLFQADEMKECLERAGFDILMTHVRKPYECEL